MAAAAVAQTSCTLWAPDSHRTGSDARNNSLGAAAAIPRRAPGGETVYSSLSSGEQSVAIFRRHVTWQESRCQRLTWTGLWAWSCWPCANP
jgi:hypothetical protein